MDTRCVIKKYLQDCRDRGLSEATMIDYAGTLEVLAVICPKLPATVDHVNWVIRKMMVVRSTDRRKQKSDSTKSKYRKNLSAFFRWAEKRYKLRNPCQDLGRWKTPDTLPRYYTREEIALIEGAARADIECALIALILDNGLRIGEVTSLLKSRIKDGCVMVKGKHGWRRVPVSPEVIAMLKGLGKGNVIWMGKNGPLDARGLASAGASSRGLASPARDGDRTRCATPSPPGTSSAAGTFWRCRKSWDTSISSRRWSTCT